MITIVKPKELVDKLWGKQKIREGETYRMMRYVLRVDHEDKVLLHNVVTGRLVVLDREEAEALKTLPSPYSPAMEQMVTEHYLVPEDYDEHQQVINLREIFIKFDDAHESKDIMHYIILPTTACNARCYYCFEQGCKWDTMTEKTAADLVDFMAAHCGGKPITINWFGGEPTVAAHRIDQICEGLVKAGVHFRSTMHTNGYLFDGEMVERAKTLWKLQALQICVDGTEDSYNKIKVFPSARDNPYERVMRNIELLLSAGIRVGLRMNFDLGNYQEFPNLMDEVMRRFGRNKRLSLSAFPGIGEYEDRTGQILHGSDDWADKERMALNLMARKEGLQRDRTKIPSLNFTACQAFHDTYVVVTPEGSFAKCPEQFGDDQVIGNIYTGITNHELVQCWKKPAELPICKDCALFPSCFRLANCSNTTYCNKSSDFLTQYHEIIKSVYDKMEGKDGKENVS